MPSKFETEIIIRPSDIDGNRHVHNSIYLEYVLAARYDQMKRCYKMPMDEFERNGWSWVVRSAAIDHKRPLTLGDTAVVRTWVMGIGNRAAGKRARSLVTIGFEIDNKSTGKLAASGTIIYVMIDVAAGKPMEIPDFVIDRYSI